MTEPETRGELPLSRQDIGAALGLLTRLPVPAMLAPNDAFRHGAWCYPMIGAGLGVIAALVQILALAAGAPTGLAASLALGALLLATGALHEDGLADAADGLGGGRSRERVLEIMRDSRIGTYGVVALTVALLARWSGIEALSEPLLILPLVGAVSRLPMVMVMAALPHARRDGLSVTVGRPGWRDVGIATGFTLILTLALGGVAGLLVLGAALIAVIPLTFWASRLLGGQTGDILGATQQIAEIACLTVIVTVVT